MKILFISKHKYPHIGGVERHIEGISRFLKQDGFKIKTISEEDIKAPDVKFVGLIYIWFWFLKNLKIISNSDLIHIHDVFIWYLPFKFIFPKKRVFITFHGWEGKWPLTKWSILNKKVANYFTNGSISIGKYINKYYGIQSDIVIYGGIDKKLINITKKTPNTIVYLGRQDKDTGIEEFRRWIKKQKTKYIVSYITNDPKPEKYLKEVEYCVPSGYLSYLEAKKHNCKILTFTNNPLKVDYWKEIRNIYDNKENNLLPTWKDIAETYKKLWQS